MPTSDRRREQNRINKANQRARDRARAEDRPIPKAVRLYPITQAVNREATKAVTLREARLAAVSALPSVRNPEVNIEVGRQMPRLPARFTRSGPQRQLQAIREQAQSQKLEEVGRGRRAQLRSELDDSTQAEQYKKYMSPEQMRRFRQLSEKIASIPLQALGILFDYEDGSNSYNAVIDRLTGSPQSVDVEEGLANLETLAETAELAGKMYSPKAIGRLGV